MIDLKYSLIIEATNDPTFFGFYSPDLEGFTGIGHSIEDCAYQARWGTEEHLELLKKQSLPVPNENPCIFILKYMDENIVNTKQDGTDRLALGRWRPWISMGRPVLPGPKLEQLPGLVKPASFARLSRAGGS